MSEFQRKDTEREWRVLEIEDDEHPDTPHIIGVEIERSVWKSPPLASGTITLRAYGLAGAAGDVTGEHGRFLGAFGGHFDLNANPTASTYTLTGGNMVLAEDLRGLRIGTYLQNEVVRWSKAQDAPGLIVPIGLSPNDALTTGERDRRNRFYEQFGIVFDWTPADHGIERASGRSQPTLTIADVHELPFVEGMRVLDAGNALRRFARRVERAEAKQRHAEDMRQGAKRSHEHERETDRQLRRAAFWLAGIASAAVVVLAVILGRVTA